MSPHNLERRRATGVTRATWCIAGVVLVAGAGLGSLYAQEIFGSQRAGYFAGWTIAILLALLAWAISATRGRRHAELRHRATHDALTGLANRAMFHERVERCIELAKRTPNYHFAVLFFDLDRFKLINDSLGHAAGDTLLVTIGEHLAGELRGTDVFTLMGPNELVSEFEGLGNGGKQHTVRGWVGMNSSCCWKGCAIRRMGYAWGSGSWRG